MIFAFVEDGTLEIHEDLAAVQRTYEGIDVESEVVHFYDETGTYLEPQFIIPNRHGTTFGIFKWVSSGVFKLVPNPTAEQDSFALALYETNSLEPNRWFTSLEHVKLELASKGVAVELAPTNHRET